jgi:tRNA-guanine family transglycosylase
MKIFLSWSPVPPDPPFWKWITLDGIVVSIALLKQKRLLERATLVGLHRLLGFKGRIFLDSGSYEDSITDKQLRPKSPEELLTYAKWMGVDLVSHLDTPFVGRNAKLSEKEKWHILEKNILNAQICHEASRRSASVARVVYVIQGWNEQSLTYCCEELAKLNERYYALGSLFGLQPQEIEFRVRLVREILGKKPKLHLFAVSNLIAVRRVKGLIDSIDSSTASVAGAMKEIIRPHGRRSHINRADEVPDCNCPICSTHKGAIFLLGREGKQNYYNQLRKIHNAYQLLASLRQIAGTNSHRRIKCKAQT